MIRKTTIIPTPYGKKRLSDLSVGDIVYNKYGVPDRIKFNGPKFKGEGIMLVLKLETGINLYIDNKQELLVRTTEDNSLTRLISGDIIEKQIGISFPLIKRPVQGIDVGPWKKIKYIGRLIERGTLIEDEEEDLQIAASSLGWKAIWNKEIYEYGLSHSSYFVNEIIEIKDNYEDYYEIITESGSILVTPNHLIFE